MRDGRDAAISHRFQTFIDRPGNLKDEDLQIRTAFTNDPEPFLTGKRSIFTRKAIRQAAEGWVRNVEETDRMGIELYKEHYISLRYEDLLADPSKWVSQLWSFLGADIGLPELNAAIEAELDSNPDADWQRKKAKTIAEALPKGKQGSWQELFTPEDRQIFHQIAAETLKAQGYEV